MKRYIVRVGEKVFNFLRLKDMQGIDKASSDCTKIYNNIRKEKFYLRRLYEDFYSEFKLKTGGYERVIELGSAGNDIKKIIPDAVTTDILNFDVDYVVDATKMPYDNDSIGSFVGVNFFHHIADTGKFLDEIDRCLVFGGKLIIIEPANTFFGRLIWKYFHTEEFDIKAGWGFEYKDFNSANGGLPYIVFIRDKKLFNKKYPDLSIRSVKLHTPLMFIICGGFSFKSLLPDNNFIYKLVRWFEYLLSPFNRFLALFYTIEVIKERK